LGTALGSDPLVGVVMLVPDELAEDFHQLDVRRV
jgi:hypothetical protein